MFKTSLYFLSFSLSGSYSQGPDEVLLQVDDSVGEEDSDNSSHHYNKVCNQNINSYNMCMTV